MVVGVLRLELHFPHPQNLKEKRGAVRRILGRCRERYPVACAEVGCQDLWQRAELGFSAVSTDEALLQRVFTQVEAHVASLGLAEVLSADTEYLHYGTEG